MIAEAAAKGLRIATAESLTAGLLAASIAETPGASSVLLGSVVSYQDEIKIQVLGVSSQLIATASAVDPEVAIQMADSVRTKFATAMNLPTQSVIGISTTGVAGPDPVGSKPVGEVYIGLSSPSGQRVYARVYSGDRNEVRKQVVADCLSILWEEIVQF